MLNSLKPVVDVVWQLLRIVQMPQVLPRISSLRFIEVRSASVLGFKDENQTLSVPVTNQTVVGDSITLPQSPWKSPGCSCTLIGLRIESHFLPSSVSSSSMVLDTGIVRVVHDAMMYLRVVVLDSAILLD